jgi:hypothetical protein
MMFALAVCAGNHGELDWRDCCEAAEVRAQVVHRVAMESNAQGLDFQPLEVGEGGVWITTAVLT